MRSDDAKVQLSARKQFEVLSPDCLLKGVAIADYDPKSQEVCLPVILKAFTCSAVPLL